MMKKRKIFNRSLWMAAFAVFGGFAFYTSAWGAETWDMGYFGKIEFSWNFVLSFLSIVLIDIILAGDNAVVIALAVKNLHAKQRKKGIIFGAGAAVALRVSITFFVAQLLQVNFIKFIGGGLILWIAVKLFIEGAPEEKMKKEAATFWQAIRIIVIADLIMSTDNILAVAGASQGNFFLLLFGLALSIPFVVFTSTLLSLLMDKYPFIIYIGAAVLGRVGGEMIMTDPFMVQILAPSKIFQYSVEGIAAIGVIVAGKVYMCWKIKQQENETMKNPDTAN